MPDQKSSALTKGCTEDQKNPAAGGKRPLGLYLHIPFCRQKCLYCDFLSAPADESTVDRYVKALARQLKKEAFAYRDFAVRTLFFGGGTPSLLSAKQTEMLMETVRNHYDLTAEAEVTMESNPGTLDEQKLAGYRKAGINRLSMGLQSACDEELKNLGRIHDFDTFLENFWAARRAGFSNINVDLMSALPGQTGEGWMETLRKAAALQPEHISAYSLIIEEGTPFWLRYGEDGEQDGTGKSGNNWPPLPSEEEERLMYEQTETFLKEKGYHRYEISNYARPGRECLHNTGYWKRTDYVGFGLGASSMVDNVRWKITDDLEEYLEYFETDPQNGESWKRERCVLTEQEQMEEFMFLGLRLSEGISLHEFRRLFGKGIREIYGPVIKKLEEQGLILFYEDGKKMRLTAYGVDVSNYVLAQFLLEE